MGSVGATEDISISDNLSYDDSQNSLETIEIDECLQSDISNNEKLIDEDSKSNEIFINPDFEDENSVLNENGNVYGWNVSTLGGQNASPQPTGMIKNVDGNNVLYVYRTSNIAEKVSQTIDFTNVDSISFKYFNPNYSQEVDNNIKMLESLTPEQIEAMGGTVEDVSNAINSYIMTFTITVGSTTITKDTIRSLNWEEINIDTSDIVGVGLFEISMPQAAISGGFKEIYFDDFMVELAPEKIVSVININSINANNVVSGFLKDISGNPLANAVINYTINDNNGSVVTADDGSFSINGVDNYEIFINYLGNKTIKATSTSIKLDNLTGPLVEAQTNASKLAGDLADANQKISNLTTQLNDTQANVSKLAGDLADANQKISNLTTQLNDAQTNPVLVNTNVVVSDLNIKAGESGVLKVTLKDASGIGLANQTINVLINGKNYNAVTGNDGVAQVSLKYDGANTYYANIYYAGNGTYKSSIATGKVVVTKKATTLTAPKKTFKVKAKTKKVAITLKSSGKAVAGKKITITIKGKTYSAKTNSKGVATIKVKLTKKGTYKYTAKFAGDNTYNTISKKGTIKVKK